MNDATNPIQWDKISVECWYYVKASPRYPKMVGILKGGLCISDCEEERCPLNKREAK